MIQRSSTGSSRRREVSREITFALCNSIEDLAGEGETHPGTITNLNYNLGQDLYESSSFGSDPVLVVGSQAVLGHPAWPLSICSLPNWHPEGWSLLGTPGTKKNVHGGLFAPPLPTPPPNLPFAMEAQNRSKGRGASWQEAGKGLTSLPWLVHKSESPGEERETMGDSL